MTKDELKKEAEEKLEQEVLDWVDNEFRDKVTAKRCQTFFTYSELVRSIFDFAEPREKRIAELEKENAELKLKLEALDGETPWKDIKDKSEVIGQLTKAKKIIKVLLHALKNEDSDYTFALENTHPILTEAEQFLKESEVK